MQVIKEWQLQQLREEYPVGTRVELIHGYLTICGAFDLAMIFKVTEIFKFDFTYLHWSVTRSNSSKID